MEIIVSLISFMKLSITSLHKDVFFIVGGSVLAIPISGGTRCH